MAQIETLLGLLELVSASGGAVDSRIRLQKEAYLLATVRLGRFRESKFDYHHYGPYSRELSDATQLAVIRGLLSETREEPDDGSYTKYSYKLTQDGEHYVQEAGSDVTSLTNLVSSLATAPWRALELAATIKFLELREDFEDRDSAVAEALRLKPATAKYLSDAKRVLSAISP